MEFRKANSSDVDQLANLRVLMLNEDALQAKNVNNTILNNTRQYLNNGLADNSVVLYIALEDDVIVAMCCLNFFVLPPNDWCTNGKTAYIGNLYTLPDYRKQGIASCLLELIIDDAKSKNCERILLNTTEAGRSLYEKYGFEKSLSAMALYPFGLAQ